MADPVCECHGETMYWQLDPRRKAAGYWRCRVRRNEVAREVQRRRYAENPEVRLDRQLRNISRIRVAN